MKHILIHVKGKEVQDMIMAVDGGVLASLEMGDKERLAEAPDKSGGYNFKLYEEGCSVEFDDLENNKSLNTLQDEIIKLKAEITKLNNELKETEGELKDSNSKNAVLNSSYLELEEKSKKAPAPNRRMRAY